MATVTAPWWLLGVLGGLVACGFMWVCWVAAGWAERAADWLRARRTWGPATEDETPCGQCGRIEPCEHDELPIELPPERTWEQMTSHQLPVVDQRMGPAERAFWSELDEFGPHGMLRPERERQGWFDADVQARLRAEYERRAPKWEAEARGHYVAMGLDYPSGLMARVREAAQ